MTALGFLIGFLAGMGWGSALMWWALKDDAKEAEYWFQTAMRESRRTEEQP